MAVLWAIATEQAVERDVNLALGRGELTDDVTRRWVDHELDGIAHRERDLRRPYIGHRRRHVCCAGTDLPVSRNDRLGRDLSNDVWHTADRRVYTPYLFRNVCILGPHVIRSVAESSQTMSTDDGSIMSSTASRTVNKMWAQLHTHAFTRVCTRVRTHVCTHVHTHVHTHVYANFHKHVLTQVYILATSSTVSHKVRHDPDFFEKIKVA